MPVGPVSCNGNKSCEVLQNEIEQLFNEGVGADQALCVGRDGAADMEGTVQALVARLVGFQELRNN